MRTVAAHRAIVHENGDAHDVVSKRHQGKEHGKLLDDVAVGFVLGVSCKVEQLADEHDLRAGRVVELRARGKRERIETRRDEE